MLFDLRGRRRRAVQATYLVLAMLMGGGLVLFGIGGEVSGGLFNAFSENTSSSGNQTIEDRIDRSEERLSAQPRDERLLKSLVRDNYALAVSRQASGATTFSEDSKDDLRKAASYWQRYLQVVDGDPDAALANYALRIYDVGALNRVDAAAKAAALVAESSNDPQSYLQLVQYAALAGDMRTADLATQKAVDLAPKNLRKEVKQNAEQIKKAAKQQPSG